MNIRSRGFVPLKGVNMQSVIGTTEKSHPVCSSDNRKWWTVTSKTAGGKKVRRFVKSRSKANLIVRLLKSHGLECSLKRSFVDLLAYDSKTQIYCLCGEKLTPRKMSSCIYLWFTTVNPYCGIVLWPHGKKYPAGWNVIVPDELNAVTRHENESWTELIGGLA